MTRFTASSGLAACRRNVDAIAVSPLDLSNQRPAFRSAARICGAAPVRTRQASSPRLTSRTQCKWFSMPQWPRAIASNRLAEASSGPRLVLAQTVSSVPLPRMRRTRSSRQTCLAPGQSRYPSAGSLSQSVGPQSDHALCLGFRPGRLRRLVASAPEGGKAGLKAARMFASKVGWLSLTVRK